MSVLSWLFCLLPVGMVLMSENRLTLTKLAQQQRVNVSTVWRWAQRGVKGQRLETFCIGGRRFTTEEAFDRFVQRTTRIANGETQAPITTRQQAKAEAEAIRYLDEMGV